MKNKYKTNINNKKEKLEQLFKNYEENKKIMANLRMCEFPRWRIDYETIQEENHDIRHQILKIDPLFFNKIKQEKEEKEKKIKLAIKLEKDQKALQIKNEIVAIFEKDLQIMNAQICTLSSFTQINKKIEDMKLLIKAKFPKIGLQFAKTGEFVAVIIN